jgi:hypothetical protein
VGGDIEISELCLKSIEPVNGFDIYVMLGEKPSTGVMNGIYFGWMEDRGNWGVYSLLLDLSADVYMAPSGSSNLYYHSSFEVELDSYLDQGWFDLRTNQLPSTGSNFFTFGYLRLMGLSDDLSVDIRAVNTTVPEPASFVIMGLGAITLLRSRKAGK